MGCYFDDLNWHLSCYYDYVGAKTGYKVLGQFRGWVLG